MRVMLLQTTWSNNSLCLDISFPEVLLQLDGSVCYLKMFIFLCHFQLHYFSDILKHNACAHRLCKYILVSNSLSPNEQLALYCNMSQMTPCEWLAAALSDEDQHKQRLARIGLFWYMNAHMHVPKRGLRFPHISTHWSLILFLFVFTAHSKSVYRLKICL